ncbi:MAG: PAS domain S-box protein, partial [Rhodothermales bacterium]
MSINKLMGGREIPSHRRVLFLVLIMTVIAIGVGLIVLITLYRTAFNQQHERLVETAHSQACLMEAMARHERQSGVDEGSGGAFDATLDQIIDAHHQYRGSGDTGEFTLAKREGDRMVFLLRHRHHAMDEPFALPFSSTFAEPMRRALSGETGTVVGLDYRGTEVLAAYEPVPLLNLGIVAKIDLAEIRAPFVRAGFQAAGVGLLLIFLGLVVFMRVSNPLVRRIEESERKYRNLVETSQDLLWSCDAEGRFTYLNKAWEQTHGYRVEEMLGKKFTDFETPSVAARDIREFERELAGGTVTDYETSHISKSGEAVHLVVKALPLRDAYGKIVGVQGSAYDITARKQAEEALKQSEERYRGLFENAPIAVWEEDFSRVKTYLDQLSDVGDQDIETYLQAHPEVVRECVKRVHVVDVNQAALTLHKARRKRELLGTLNRLFEDTSYAALAQEVVAIWHGRGQLEIEMEVRALDGTWRHVMLHWAVAPGHEQTYDRVLVSLVDITDRKQAEDHIRAQEQQYRDLVQSTSAILWRGDPRTFRFTFVSREAETLLGYARERWIEEPEFWLEHVHPEDREWVPAFCAQATAELRPHTFDYRMIASDGRVVWLRDIVNVVAEKGVPVESVGVMIDITELKRAEAALRESEERFRRIFEEGPLGMCVVGSGFSLVNANATLCRMLGYTKKELLGCTFLDLTHPDEREKETRLAIQVLKGEIPYAQVEMRLLRKTGEVVWARVTGSVVRDQEGLVLYGLGMVEDITESKQVEGERKRFIAELEARNAEMERFTYVLSHDLQNPLVTIKGFLGLLEKDAADGNAERMQWDIKQVQDAADIMYHLLRDLVELPQVSRLANPSEEVPLTDL